MPETKTQAHPILSRIPALEQGKRFPSMPTDEEANALFDDVLAGGKDTIVDIINQLRPIDDGKDWRARFLLHALASYTGVPGQKAAREKLEKIYAGELLAERPNDVKRFLVMQLQYFAGAASVDALAAQLKGDDRMLIAAAAAALGAIGQPAVKALTAAKAQSGEQGRIAIDHALMQIAQGLG